MKGLFNSIVNQQSALAADIIALMDALKFGKAIIGGFDWGARTANMMAALWPECCKALVSVSGYLIGNHESNKMPLPLKAELAAFNHICWMIELELRHAMWAKPSAHGAQN